MHEPTPSPLKAASVSEGVPDGWKLVPIEPTDDMLAMGDEAMVDTIETDNWLRHCRNAWSAMLSASPEAPSLSAAAPASGGVDAVVKAVEDALLFGAALTVPDAVKLATNAIRSALTSAPTLTCQHSLQVAPTSGSEAGGEAVGQALAKLDAARQGIWESYGILAAPILVLIDEAYGLLAVRDPDASTPSQSPPE